VAVETGLFQASVVALITRHRKQKKPLVRVFFAQLRRNLVAVHHWQANVQEYDLRSKLAGGLQGGRAVVHGKRLVAIMLEKLCQDFSRTTIVLHDEDPSTTGVVWRGRSSRTLDAFRRAAFV